MTDIDLGSDLLNFIISEGFEPGDRLPTITELQADDKLGVSTSKVREQLEVARTLGMVDVRSRTGTRLRPFSFTPAVRLSLLYALAQDPNAFTQFSELRTHIETAFWHEACAMLEDDDRAVMRACVDRARAMLTGAWIRIPHAEHRTFHLTVFKRLENPFVIGILEAYWDAYDAVQLNTYAEYSYLQSVWDYHESILDAICAGDFDAALARFIEHTRLLRYQPRVKDMKGEPAPGNDGAAAP
ncbi:MAG: FadR/GntR family transcriptional regulator [Chloroflexota bacterium]